MTPIVDGIIRKTYSRPKRVIANLIPIIEPNPGDVCFIADNEELIPVKIIDGKLYGTHGFSNTWTWENLFSGKEEIGYGGFFTIRFIKEEK